MTSFYMRNNLEVAAEVTAAVVESATVVKSAAIVILSLVWSKSQPAVPSPSLPTTKRG